MNDTVKETPCPADAPEGGKNSEKSQESLLSGQEISLRELVLETQAMQKELVASQKQLMTLLTQIVIQQGDLLAILIDNESDDEEEEPRPFSAGRGTIKAKNG